MIYLSTGGFKNLTFKDSIELLAVEEITAFELSGGLPCNDIIDELKSLCINYSLSLHNYFPPPIDPFVFNLGTLNDVIAEKSIQHAKFAIDCASIVNSGYYSFHAGYLIDPLINELGNKISKRKINDREKSKTLFIERVNLLSKYAKRKNIRLMIENNVLSYKNFAEFNENPLLMVDYEETAEIISKTNNNVGLLIDVAHLKVSAKTLRFSPTDYLKSFKDTVFGYHFSDNNGLEDSNEVFDENSWFWDFINKELEYYSLEIYDLNPKVLKKQLLIAQNIIES